MNAKTVDVLFLCADWCNVCQGLKGTFHELRTTFSDIRWVWVDIESYGEIFDSFEIDNFPSLLVLINETPWFLGSTDPRKDVIVRTVQAVATASQSMLKETMNESVVQMLRTEFLK